MDISLTNSATRKKERFTPLDPDNVRMYVCGPTVYDRAHLGNARPVVVFDVLYRLLRHVYGPEHVTYVRNFTDVDDKINARAAESGRAIGEITAETTQWFLDDMKELGALKPSIRNGADHERAMPRATQYITQMVAMIEALIDKGHAYAAEGHVLFAVDSWKDGYGRLSGRPAPGSRWHPTSATRWISCCGSRLRWICRGGRALGVAGGPDGISSAPPWPRRCWARPSTSTAAATT